MDASKTISLLRRMRHDFGNYLQIISGYNDLGYQDEVKAYLLKITEEMNQERLLFGLDNPEVSLHLYEQMLLAKDIGVILRYKEIDVNSGALLEVMELFPVIKSIVEEYSLRDEIIVEVSIYEGDDQIKVALNSPLWGKEPKELHFNKP